MNTGGQNMSPVSGGAYAQGATQNKNRMQNFNQRNQDFGNSNLGQQFDDDYQKQNSLRFSFEKVIGNNKAAFHPSMNTLTEENEESMEDEESFNQANHQSHQYQQQNNFAYENQYS